MSSVLSLSVLYPPLCLVLGVPSSVSILPHKGKASLVSHLLFPAKRYTRDHEVVKYDDESGVGTVSITDYAQKSLGDVVFVELPETGATVQQGGQ